MAGVVPWKRVPFIAEILAELPENYTWTHYGDGPDLAELTRRIDELDLNDRVTLRGNVTNAVLREELGAGPAPQILVNVSTREGVPVSIMEAFSAHVPVVASIVGGNPEIVDDAKNGRLADVDADATTYAAAIRDVAENWEAYAAKGYSTWRDKYYAAENYRHFVATLEQWDGHE